MRPRAETSGGYVLLLVAMVVALMALFILMAANVQGPMLGSLRNLREEARLELAAQRIEARVAFLLLTEPMGGRSILVGGDPNVDASTGMAADDRAQSASGRRIQEVMLDGRIYRVAAASDRRRTALVSIQDESGLLNLNAGDETGVSNMLALEGVPSGTARVLAGALADYVDEDDATRQYGAESADYARARLPPPPNHRIATPWTALDALGWRNALTPRLRMAFFAAASAGPRDYNVNVNTAPASVLRAVYNIDERTARSILDRRRAAPFRSSDEVLALTGESTRAEAPASTTMPGNVFRVVVRLNEGASAARRAFESELILAGGDAERPIYWRGGWLSRNAGEPSGDEDRPAQPGEFPTSPHQLAP